MQSRLTWDLMSIVSFATEDKRQMFLDVSGIFVKFKRRESLWSMIVKLNVKRSSTLTEALESV